MGTHNSVIRDGAHTSKLPLNGEQRFAIRLPQRGKWIANLLSGVVMSRREVIQPHKGDKRYARRDEQGHFTANQVNVGKSLAAHRRQKAKTIVPKGHGERGDEKKG